MASTKLQIIIDAKDNASGVLGRIGGALGTVGSAAAIGLGILVSGIGLAGAKILSLGSDAAEMQNKFDTAFGANAADWGNRFDLLADSVGRNKFELRDFGATIQAILGPMGLSTDAAANMSVELTGLAVDLSSFFNTAEPDALNALRSALIGETEPMRQYGVVLNQAAIEQEALNAGLLDANGKMSAAAKAQATYNLIMQQTTAAQGDAARTSGGWANQMRALQASLSEAATAAGLELLPILTPLLQNFVLFAQQVMPLAVARFKEFAAELGTTIGPAMLLIGDAWDRIVIAFGGTPAQMTPAQAAIEVLGAVLDLVVISVQAVAIGAQGLAWGIEQTNLAVQTAIGLWDQLQTIWANLKMPELGGPGLAPALAGGGGQSPAFESAAPPAGFGGQFGGSFDFGPFVTAIANAITGAPPPVVNVQANLDGAQIANSVSVRLGGESQGLSRIGGHGSMH